MQNFIDYSRITVPRWRYVRDCESSLLRKYAELRLPGFFVDDGRNSSRVLRVIRVLVAAAGAVRPGWISSASGTDAAAALGATHVSALPM